MTKPNVRRIWPLMIQHFRAYWGDHIAISDLVSKLDNLEAKLLKLQENAVSQQSVRDIDSKLDRMWLHLDFLRTHSAAYLGSGVSLTYLPDDMPILVNSNDFGGPLNLINSGYYERDNLEVLYSFLRDNTVFADVGANLGFFSLKMGDRLRRHGRVLAFEPNPRIVEIAWQSAYVNGLNHVIEFQTFGLSDVNAGVDFLVPKKHLGGGRVGRTDDTANYENTRAWVRRLDDVFDQNFTIDLMKIDIENHELAALRGMREVIARSRRLVILFEKLDVEIGYEADIEALLGEFGFELYSIGFNAQLAPIPKGQLAPYSGCVLAIRSGQLDSLDRRRVSIYPSQFDIPGSTPPSPGTVWIREGEAKQALFTGPYWWLQRGVYDLHFHGKITGEIEMTLCERYGFATQTWRLSGDRPVWQFINDRDLVRYELRTEAAMPGTRVEIERLELVRIA